MSRFFRQKPVLQAEHSECGLAVCAFVLSGLGNPATLNGLRMHFGVPRGGLTFNDLNSVFSSFNVSSRGVRVESLGQSYRPLSEQTPFIAHWDSNHYVVVVRISKKSVLIMDPAKGYETLSLNEAERHFDGNLLLVSTSNPSTTMGKHGYTESHNLLFSLMKSSRFSMAMVILLLLIGKGLSLLPPMVIRQVVDASPTLNVSNSGIGILLLYMCFTFLVSFGSSIAGARLSMKWSRTLNVSFVDTLLGKKLEYFINRSQGSLLYKLGLVGNIQSLLTSMSVGSAVDYLSLIIYFLYLLYLSPSITIIVVVLTLIIAAISIAYARIIARLNRRSIEEQAQAQAILSEAISAPETIKSNGLEGYIRSRWRNLFEVNLVTNYRLSKLNGLFQSLLSSVLVCLPLFTVLLATIMAGSQHPFSAGDLFAYITVVGYIGAPLTTMGTNVLQLGSLTSSLDQVDDIFDTDGMSDKWAYKQSEDETPNAVKVRVQNASFKFSSFEKPILDGFDLTVSAGDKIAIVGVSGSGKSTLLRILAGLLDPTAGNVEFWDNDKQRRIQNPRDVISFVPQDSFLFGDSLAENLGINTVSRISPQLYSAIYEGCGLKSIAMPGVDIRTIRLSEGGKDLSGGQKQRISVARALLQNKPIVLLDEPTSSLDGMAEDSIAKLLKQMPSTVILVSHRLSSVLKMDNVIVLDNGKVVEQGTPEYLANINGQFHRIFASQLTGKESE